MQPYDEIREQYSVLSEISRELDELNEKGLLADKQIFAIKIREDIAHARATLEAGYEQVMLSKDNFEACRWAVERIWREMHPLRLKSKSISSLDNNEQSKG